MNGDEVRNVKFGRGLYDAAQVNDLLERIADELDAGRPAGPLIANVTFQKHTTAWHGYDIGAVGWFLDQFRRREDPTGAARTNADPWRHLDADPYCIHREPDDPAPRITRPSQRECADAWRDFGQQPGTLLSWVRTGALRRELRTTDLQTVASFRGVLGGDVLRGTFRAGGKTCTLKKVTPSSRLGITETISHGWPAHHTPAMSQLLDETGMPILHWGVRYIEFPGQRWLRLPIRGDRRSNAIMTAVDQDGNKVARYRYPGSRKTMDLFTASWGPMEIMVHPCQRLTDELALALAVSARGFDYHWPGFPGGG